MMGPEGRANDTLVWFGLRTKRSIVPRKHLYIYIIITVVAVAGGLLTGPIIDYFRHLFQPGTVPHP
jgi:hypothetical protein